MLPAVIGVSLNCCSFSKKQKDQTLASFLNSDDKSDSDYEQPIRSKVYMKCDNKNVACKKAIKELDEPIEDNISKIPILEEIQSVQPEREKDESILTHDGFAKFN